MSTHITFITVFYPSQVVLHFFHQRYKGHGFSRNLRAQQFLAQLDHKSEANIFQLDTHLKEKLWDPKYVCKNVVQFFLIFPSCFFFEWATTGPETWERNWDQVFWWQTSHGKLRVEFPPAKLVIGTNKLSEFNGSTPTRGSWEVYPTSKL